MRQFPENRLYRALRHPLALAAGLLLLGLSAVQTVNLFICAVPGYILCFAWVLIFLHRRPGTAWVPRKITLRTLARTRSLRIGTDLILTGRMRMARVASPIALSKTLSIRSQSSSFLLATAAALTCPRMTEQSTQNAIHHSLTLLGIDPEKMQQQWYLLSLDAPEGFTGVTVRDGNGTRTFCCGDPLPMILSCGKILTGSARPMETEDRTELLHTLDGMRNAGGSVIAYAMADSPSAAPENIVFLGMLSMEPELHSTTVQELSALSGDADVFADFPDNATPEAILGLVHPSSKCPDAPLSVTLRPRRSACMTPVSDRSDGWAESFLQWRQWSRELLARSRFSIMALLPALLWLLMSAIEPGRRMMTLYLIPAFISLCQQRALPSPVPSRRWMLLWPTVTLLLAVFISILLPAETVATVFLPGMILCAFASLAMYALPLYTAFSSRERRIFVILFAAAAVILAVLYLLVLNGTPAQSAAILLGPAWGVGSMIFLCRRLEDRL